MVIEIVVFFPSEMLMFNRFASLPKAISHSSTNETHPSVHSSSLFFVVCMFTRGYWHLMRLFLIKTYHILTIWRNPEWGYREIISFSGTVLCKPSIWGTHILGNLHLLLQKIINKRLTDHGWIWSDSHWQPKISASLWIHEDIANTMEIWSCTSQHEWNI